MIWNNYDFFNALEDVSDAHKNIICLIKIKETQ